MEKSRVEVEKRRCDSRFPLSFYFRIANQIIKQARVYRDEQSITDLYCTLNRYSSFVSKIIPQHPSYSTYSSKEKLRHRKILKEFSKEMETLRPRLGRNVQQLERSKSNGSGSNHAAKESKVKHSGTVDNNIQSPNISVNDVSIFRTGSIEHYFVPAEDVELSSVVMIDPSTGCAPCEPRCLISPAMANDGDVNVHIVTQSSPSPVLSFFEDAPCAARISHINSNSSSSHNESSVSTTIHNVHISARLMEDFLELAKDNTDKDLETCGVLGAFLVNAKVYSYFLCTYFLAYVCNMHVLMHILSIIDFLIDLTYSSFTFLTNTEEWNILCNNPNNSEAGINFKLMPGIE